MTRKKILDGFGGDFLPDYSERRNPSATWKVGQTCSDWGGADKLENIVRRPRRTPDRPRLLGSGERLKAVDSFRDDLGYTEHRAEALRLLTQTVPLQCI